VPSDWTEVAEFYRDLVIGHGWKVQPMLNLVESIAASKYANLLFATTSHAALLICKNRESFERRNDVLRIEAKSDSLTFEFRETDHMPIAWSRTCYAAEGFTVLEHFLRDLKRWFVE
jgi:hypothetical protein